MLNYHQIFIPLETIWRSSAKDLAGVRLSAGFHDAALLCQRQSRSSFCEGKMEGRTTGKSWENPWKSPICRESPMKMDGTQLGKLNPGLCQILVKLVKGALDQSTAWFMHSI